MLIKSRHTYSLTYAVLTWFGGIFILFLLGRAVKASLHLQTEIFTGQFFAEQHQPPIPRDGLGLEIRLHPRSRMVSLLQAVLSGVGWSTVADFVKVFREVYDPSSHPTYVWYWSRASRCSWSPPLCHPEKVTRWIQQ